MNQDEGFSFRPLKHSLYSDEDDVVFISKDLQRGADVDYEPTIHHYEDLFREKGVKGIRTIVPFNQLKKEYTSYEMKVKFANMYDGFLVDAVIAKHVTGTLGSVSLEETLWSIGTFNFVSSFCRSSTGVDGACMQCELMSRIWPKNSIRS